MSFQRLLVLSLSYSVFLRCLLYTFCVTLGLLLLHYFFSISSLTFYYWMNYFILCLFSLVGMVHSLFFITFFVLLSVEYIFPFWPFPLLVSAYNVWWKCYFLSLFLLVNHFLLSTSRFMCSTNLKNKKTILCPRLVNSFVCDLCDWYSLFIYVYITSQFISSFGVLNLAVK